MGPSGLLHGRDQSGRAPVRADQAGETTFPAFVRACWDAGIAWYDVDAAARTCTYYGSDGDSYTEVNRSSRSP
ncbi:DUF1398 family protein [Streptomyces sp. CRPSP2-6A1]|uniref:DUF1398 family protein n=1 Tax=Streptomyces sp. CRPSP2-6A1 TaxID=2799588 RepID=UPI0027DDEAA0|nr:DUF1398 family protein [Streptomyces sp. CRPSP2-6A1]